MITLEEAMAIVEDRIVTGQITAPHWATLVLDQDELYFLLTQPHGVDIGTREFSDALDALETKLFGTVVSI